MQVIYVTNCSIRPTAALRSQLDVSAGHIGVGMEWRLHGSITGTWGGNKHVVSMPGVRVVVRTAAWIIDKIMCSRNIGCSSTKPILIWIELRQLSIFGDKYPNEINHWGNNQNFQSLPVNQQINMWPKAPEPGLLTLKGFLTNISSRKLGCDWLMLKHQPITSLLSAKGSSWESFCVGNAGSWTTYLSAWLLRTEPLLYLF